MNCARFILGGLAAAFGVLMLFTVGNSDGLLCGEPVAPSVYVLMTLAFAVSVLSGLSGMAYALKDEFE